MDKPTNLNWDKPIIWEPSTVVIIFQVCLIPFVQNRFTFEVEIVKGTKKRTCKKDDFMKIGKIEYWLLMLFSKLWVPEQIKVSQLLMTHYNSSLKSMACYRFLFKKQFHMLFINLKTYGSLMFWMVFKMNFLKGYHVNCCHWLLQNCSRVEPGR